jgi:hypothetical protein
MSAIIYKDCGKCGEPVHRNAKVTCKACGAVSPWAAADVPAPEADALAALSAPPDDAPPVPTGLGEHDLDPSDEQVIGYLRALPDAAAAARATQAEIDTAMTGPHVFMEKFSCMIGPVMGHFKIGQVVTDFVTIKVLQHENAPMVPVADAPGMACCPKCLHVFRVPTVIPARRRG